MRIILSGKGFDSDFGGVPSPILPDGELLSLPIPEMNEPKQRCRYRDIRFRDLSLDQVIDRLTRGRPQSHEFAHLDPDLRRQSIDRHSDWRPAFGQALAAESHLVREGVGAGDLFLFFGWFRQVDSNWRYVRGARDLHVLFGWLQVDRKVMVAEQRPPAAVANHPHFVGPPYGKHDAIYVSLAQLAVPTVDILLPGAGLFPRLAPSLVLTAERRSRSIWNLPAAFADEQGRLRLSYHRDKVAELASPGRIMFQSMARGQEFVVDGENVNDIYPWLAEVFRAAA